MKKKAPIKTIIIKAPKIRPFDLTGERKGEEVRIIEALNSLKANAGWIYLSQIFDLNLKTLEKSIITKMEDGKKLTDAEVDLQRVKHAYLTELLEKPDYYLKQFMRQDSKDDGLDPYDKEQVPHR